MNNITCSFHSPATSTGLHGCALVHLVVLGAIKIINIKPIFFKIIVMFLGLFF